MVGLGELWSPLEEEAYITVPTDPIPHAWQS